MQGDGIGGDDLRRLLLVIAGPVGAAYGPEAPPGPPVPGGFSIVLVSRTIGPGRAARSQPAPDARAFDSLSAHGRSSNECNSHLPARGSRNSRAPPRRERASSPASRCWRIASMGHPSVALSARQPSVLIVSDTRISKKSTVLGWKQSLHRFTRVAADVSSHRASVTTRRSGEYLVVSPR